jgi:O-6-methylguanine DNA methyltransferase
MKLSEPQWKVYNIVTQIPVGKVLTYQKVAKLARVKSPRVVGNVLHNNEDSARIPCHRVVHRDGTLAINYKFGGIKAQEDKLRNEGVEIIDGKVNLKKHLWQPTL